MTIFPALVARVFRPAELGASAARGLGSPRSLRWRRVSGLLTGATDGLGEISRGGGDAPEEEVSADEPGAESPGVESKSGSTLSTSVIGLLDSPRRMARRVLRERLG
jgi:hypothetical protein